MILKSITIAPKNIGGINLKKIEDGTNTIIYKLTYINKQY